MTMFLLFITIGLTISAATILLMWLSNPTYHPGNYTAAPLQTIDTTQPRILLISFAGKWLGGGENHVLSLYKMLLRKGYHASILILKNTQLQEQLIKEQLPFYTTYAGMFSAYLRPLFHIILTNCLKIIYRKEHITSIHCNATLELKDVVTIAQQNALNIIYTRHTPEKFPTEKMRGVNAAIAVNPAIESSLVSANKAHNLGISTITCIPPFFNVENFLAFRTQQTRNDFFKKNFNIDLHGLPVICTIANFYMDDSHKSHRLLLEAIHILVHTKKRFANFILAGNTNNAKSFIELAQQLAIDQYTHFPGFVEQIPALLYHSDFHVLASSAEAFGLVHLEAAIMKKPSIGATDTGATSIIQHEKTGLLFRNSNSDDLACQMGRLLDDPAWCKELGANAYQHVVQNFVPEVTFARHAAVYQELASHAQPK